MVDGILYGLFDNESHQMAHPRPEIQIRGGEMRLKVEDTFKRSHFCTECKSSNVVIKESSASGYEYDVFPKCLDCGYSEFYSIKADELGFLFVIEG